MIDLVLQTVAQRQQRDSRYAVWRQYPRPDTTDGVLMVPL